MADPPGTTLADGALAHRLAYEKPEADVLLRPPRNPKKDHLVNWQLIVFAYGFIGVLETVSSFAVSYWYAERCGVAFGRLWFGFGVVPPGVSPARGGGFAACPRRCRPRPCSSIAPAPRSANRRSVVLALGESPRRKRSIRNSGI